MKFLIDRCAGHRLAQWLRAQGHDVAELRDRGGDPGDRVVLECAVTEQRILVTIDTDFGALIFQEHAEHAGLLQLPDVPAQERIHLIADALTRHAAALEHGSIVTVRGGKIRVSHEFELPRG